ncbi:MAG: transglycosylase SLT domain-containing protein, partial [Gemmatimonadales bacterium]|nr:transglycosylase SLT domain-containing protein [Gemmatimonadales bacterium]
MDAPVAGSTQAGVATRSRGAVPLGSAADSLADAAALDRLQDAAAADALPELAFGDAPVWDLNVVAYADHPRVQYYVNYFSTTARDRFQIWLERMPTFEPFARASMAEQGLPGDLVYLALIESGFSPVAVSRARAVGIWQFMSATGKSYGLRVTPWIDERRDPIKSTVAAARHLKDLTDRFGSHYLAAAAYNGGAGRVGRGLQQIASAMGYGDESTELTSDDAFFELADTRHIYQETKDYVPKLIAAAILAKEPARYGFEAVEGGDPFPHDSVIVEGGTGLDKIARLTGVELDVIRALNPHILRGVTPPGERYAVRLPTGTAERVSAAYAALPPEERPTVLTHVVRRGETVSGIARRYGVSQNLLMTANRVARASSLQIGTTLYIPVSGTEIPATLLREPVPARSGPTTHIVRRGDTVGTIARRYGVTERQVIALNKLGKKAVIKVGQRLRVSRLWFWGGGGGGGG